MRKTPIGIRRLIGNLLLPTLWPHQGEMALVFDDRIHAELRSGGFQACDSSVTKRR